MAGDWIKMRTNLDTDPAVVRISSGLKLDRFGIVGRLHKIWAWANEHSIDGQDVPVDADFLDSLCATPGFSAQLRAVGWLSGRDGSLNFPNFLRHNGQSAKQRASDAVRKQTVRKLSAKCPDQNRTNLGPEKRREEKSNTNKQTGHLSNEKFAEAFRAFVASSINNHHWPCDEISQQAWLYELQSHPVDEATAMLWYSVRRGVKVPITNGDHKRELITSGASSGGGGFGKRRKTEKELFGDD